MSMNDTSYVWPHPVNEQMHRNLAGHIAVPCYAPSFEVYGHQIFRVHHAFAEAGGGSENRSVLQPDRQVSVGGRDVLALIHHACEAHDLFPVLKLTFHDKDLNGRGNGSVSF